MFYIVLGILVILVIGYVIFTNPSTSTNAKKSSAKLTPKYNYTAKDYLMTRNEASLFRNLETRIGHLYYIFPQVHLDDILNHKQKGQNWAGALSYIQRKSVDFVLVDKNTLVTKAAIELDDSTHDSTERKTRDDVVNTLFQRAGIKLVRGRSHDEIINKILQEIN